MPTSVCHEVITAVPAVPVLGVVLLKGEREEEQEAGTKESWLGFVTETLGAHACLYMNPISTEPGPFPTAPSPAAAP